MNTNYFQRDILRELYFIAKFCQCRIPFSDAPCRTGWLGDRFKSSHGPTYLVCSNSIRPDIFTQLRLTLAQCSHPRSMIRYGYSGARARGCYQIFHNPLTFLQPLLFFSSSHLSASILRSLPARIMACQCFLSSAISVVIRFLAIYSFTRSRISEHFVWPQFLCPSTAICNVVVVALHLNHRCPCPNDIGPFSLQNAATCLAFALVL